MKLVHAPIHLHLYNTRNPWFLDLLNSSLRSSNNRREQELSPQVLTQSLRSFKQFLRHDLSRSQTWSFGPGSIDRRNAQSASHILLLALPVHNLFVHWRKRKLRRARALPTCSIHLCTLVHKFLTCAQFICALEGLRPSRRKRKLQTSCASICLHNSIYCAVHNLLCNKGWSPCCV